MILQALVEHIYGVRRFAFREQTREENSVYHRGHLCRWPLSTTIVEYEQSLQAYGYGTMGCATRVLIELKQSINRLNRLSN